MTQAGWNERLAQGRAAAQTRVEALSASARDAAAVARARVGSTYSHARNRAATLASEGRALAGEGAAISSKAAKKGRTVVDRAMVHSRDLIAERPVSAVIIGLTAGVVLGFLADRIAHNRAAQRALEADDEFTGG